MHFRLARDLAVGVALSLVAGLSMADQSFDINLNDDSVRARYTAVVPAQQQALFIGDGSLLYAKDDDTDDKLFLAAGGFQVGGDAAANPHHLLASLGGRVYWLHGEPGAGDADDIDGVSLALGGEVRFSFARLDRLVFAAHAFFSPDIISFADVEQLLDYAVRVEYQVLRPASVYLGYRQVKVDTDPGGNASVDNGAHIGFRLDF